MPNKPLHECNKHGCYRLTRDRFCELHTNTQENYRGSSSERGYDRRWQAIRKRFLQRNPLCVDCLKGNKVKAATDVHHKIAKRNGGSGSFDNLMALCHECHSKRTGNGE